MKTQLDRARDGEITPEMKEAAAYDDVTPEYIRDGIANGHIVINANPQRKCRVIGIGQGLRTKINASIGTSPDIIDFDMEVEKAKVAEKAGADTLMELSTGGDLGEIRKRVLDAISLTVGTVPLYQAVMETIDKKGSVVHMESDFLFEIIERQAAEGIGFMAIHCGINMITLERLRKQGYRYGGLVSRGGSFLTAWMNHNKKENPLYEELDRLIDIMKKYDVILSLGNGLRAGAVHDSTDRAQIQELIMNSEVAEYAQSKGVQIIVEGPGHIPIDEIEANVIIQKRMSNNAPFYMLGPITTDVTPGYDHISAAIGAALSSRYGADFICYVTPPEHLALPTPDDVREGVMAAKVATHVGDMVKLKDKVKNQDLKMGIARRDLDWKTQFETAITSERAEEIRKSRPPMEEETCTMCGSVCSLKGVMEYYEDDLKNSRKRSYSAAVSSNGF
ncbi:MAG: phosphomethylpyrimidine synthase ThiC [Candidatus Scalindua rubra]|uniref:Phosphomethylpyrimidine synthase n=1 Tax=Candidatus Scalindua brodae TaxID=237368 RepID=A0A0B0EIY6_9BACT|nr:MAG: thiamine biosynthesis protein [Candidatus Scalindua brodae]MBZ0110356.1 phosphomethylpyrimidine synthase ThiC [Candidatus Scalindua rubra]TWU30655.1 Phosphomethylpyrimidine synthase [Candidatus Brocadiaceae bacterium S225]